MMATEFLHKRRFTNRDTLVSYVVAVAREAYSPDRLVAKYPDGHITYQRSLETADEFHSRAAREAGDHQT